MRRDIAVGVGVIVAGALLLAGLVFGIYGLTWHSQHVSCLRLHEQTGNPTRMARSGMGGECYIRINGNWIPEDRYRGIQGDMP